MLSLAVLASCATEKKRSCVPPTGTEKPPRIVWNTGQAKPVKVFTQPPRTAVELFETRVRRGWSGGKDMLRVRHVVVIGFLLLYVGRTPLSSGEHADDRPQPDISTGNEDPCRVAVCLSGHIRSFVHPVVHQSIRHNVIEAIEADGCQVDVFAYATLEDTVALMKQVGVKKILIVRPVGLRDHTACTREQTRTEESCFHSLLVLQQRTPQHMAYPLWQCRVVARPSLSEIDNTTGNCAWNGDVCKVPVRYAAYLFAFPLIY